MGQHIGQHSRLVLILIVCLVLGMGAMLWLGYRATREWQRSTATSVERRGNAVLVLLSAALDYDMKGSQSVLLSINERNLNLTAPYDLANRFAGAFARFPYPESFFAWKNTPDDQGVTYFFDRSDRPPDWAMGNRAPDTFPVVIARDPVPPRALVAAVRAEAIDGSPFVVLETEVAGTRYQVVAHFLHDGASQRLYGLVGFTVNLSWVRNHYFGELITQIERISGGQNAIGIEILDDHGRVAASTGPVTSGGPVYTRGFPLLFVDRALLSYLPRRGRPDRVWTSRITIANDPTLLAASRGARRTQTLLVLAAVTIIGALAFIVRANRKMAVLGAMKAEFVSTVTHEMKAPLAFIRLASDTLAKGRYTSQSTVEEYSKMLALQADDLTRLIDNVLSWTRVIDTKQAYAFELLDVPELVEESLDRFQPRLTDLGFEIQLQLSADLPRVRGDRSMMLHVIDNLLDNAIKYSEAGRLITIGARSCDGFIRLQVVDNGDGIHPDDVPRVFEKFFRGRGTKQRGSGLGLAIVERIMHDHGGSVIVRSTLGEGTSIELSVPSVDVA